MQKCDNLAVCLHFIVADEVHMIALLDQFTINRTNRFFTGTFPVLTGFLALLFHAAFKASLIDAETVGFNDVGGQVGGEAVGVIEFEKNFAGDDCRLLFTQDVNLVIEDAQAIIESLDEAFLFLLDYLGDKALALRFLRVSLGHEVENESCCFVENRVGKTEHFGVSHGAAHDAA